MNLKKKIAQMKTDGPSAAEPQPQRREGAKTQRKAEKTNQFFSSRLCVFAIAALPPPSLKTICQKTTS